MVRRALMRRSVRVTLALVLVAWVSWRVLRAAVGSPRAELQASWSESTRVLARDGRLLGERASSAGLRGQHTKLDEVSPRLVLATLASEDRAFYRHDGIDRVALLRALVTDITHFRIVSGGSTITSQLVKRLDHQGKPHPRTLRTKLVEMARAQNLEAEVDKRSILEAYLNHIDYGHGLAGPEAAARAYFGVPAADVSLAQAALLAVLPRAPSALDPYRHLDRATVRQRALLRAMRTRGDISAEDLDRALDEKLVVTRRPPNVLVAPHVVLAVARNAGDVRTTLDFDLQHDAEGILSAHIAGLRARGAGSAAAIVVDNATGEVLASVGSADYFDVKSAGAVDLVRARRQAGSTLKPFLYARAFERGMSPMEPLADVPTDLGTTGAVYAPDNFDGSFVGPVSAREALAGSLNVPAVRLVADMGAREAVAVLRRAGLELKEGAEKYGASIALGSGEVSPRELAEAYVVLARGGERIRLREVAASGNANANANAGTNAGAIALGGGERVLDGAAVALVTDALSDPLARVRGLHARGPFELPFAVAVKTGTSTGFRDAWSAGYTHERTVVVWVGNANGSATNHVTGAAGAGPIFFELMKRAMRDVGARGALADRELTEEAEVCALSGARPGEDCEDRVVRRFARGRAPRQGCTMHRHGCAVAGGKRIVALPASYSRLLGERASGAPGMDAHGHGWFLASAAGCPEAPASGGGGAVGAGEAGQRDSRAGADVDERPGGGPRIVLVRPHSGAVFHADEAKVGADVFELIAATEGMPDATPLEVLVDGEVRASLAPPYRGRVPITRGEHSIEVRPRDVRTPGRVARAEIVVR